MNEHLTRGQFLKLRSLRKAAHAERCSVQAKWAKRYSVQAKWAKRCLIADNKGRNGRSMSLELLAHHETIS